MKQLAGCSFPTAVAPKVTPAVIVSLPSGSCPVSHSVLWCLSYARGRVRDRDNCSSLPSSRRTMCREERFAVAGPVGFLDRPRPQATYQGYENQPAEGAPAGTLTHLIGPPHVPSRFPVAYQAPLAGSGQSTSPHHTHARTRKEKPRLHSKGGCVDIWL